MIEIKNYDLIFAENQVINTERLVLRPVTLADAEDMYAFASDKEVTSFIYDPHETVEHTRASIANYFMKQPLGKFGIELRENQKMIGTIDLRVDKDKATGEVGYAINADYWRKGYATEAVRALLVLGFDQMNLIHIAGMHDEENPASGGVMKKVGMKQEGRIPNFRLFRGRPVTYLQLGMTIEDWQNR